jgi:Na+-driven multidrug efflux pump
MKLLHQIVGIIVVIIFLLTGQYLELYYPHMDEVGDGMRMLFRSRHIYILLAGLLNIGIGSYFSYRKKRWRKVLQLTGSALVLVAPFLLLAAFFYEPPLANLQRTFTLPAIVSLLAGTLLHLLSGARQDRDISTYGLTQ